MNYSLYFHIPFCTHRCAYCDFNTYAGQENSLPNYVQALCREIEFIAFNSPDKINIHTIFFGGGTPSLLSPDQFKSILHTAYRSFNISNGAEVTIEANPGTVAFDNLQKYRNVGINRISLGVQSGNTEELRMLERAHNFFDVIEAVTSARKAGFENLNLDLIYGLPEQTLQTWQTSVRRVLDLHPDHISAYALTLEHGTPFGRWSARGLLPTPDPDLAAEMYEWASDAFETAGLRQYEISNWAKENHRCMHNLQYWRGLPYLGLGAGAHGYANSYRYSNVLRIKTYIERFPVTQEFVNDNLQSAKVYKISDTDFRMSGTTRIKLQFPLTSATVNFHHQTQQDDMSEFMITGLRLTREGISPQNFYSRFDRQLKDVYGEQIEDLINLGLLERGNKTSEANETSEVLRLTTRGRLLGNRVFVRFV
jgi:oxygen-independent coproporphyrinogen III oxidase